MILIIERLLQNRDKDIKQANVILGNKLYSVILGIYLGYCYKALIT